MKKMPAAKTGPCIGGCGTVCTDYDFCHGCKQFICEGCDKRSPGAMGSHSKNDHLVRNAEEED